MYRSKAMLNKLILLLSLRVLSYFTLFPDSVMLTQLVKTSLRLLLTVVAFFMVKSLRDKFRSHEFAYTNFTPFLLYGGYLLLGLCSLAWASLPNYALLQWLMVVEALVFAWFFTQLMAFYNAVSDNHARFSLVFGRAALFICAGFLIGLWIDPETFSRLTHQGSVSRLGGIIINPNELGLFAGLCCVMGYAELLDKRPMPINLLAIAVGVAVLLLTQSRSSLIAFLVVSAIFMLRLGNIRLIMLSTAAAVAVVPYLFFSIVVKDGDMEEVMSMTGRIPFWQDLLRDGFSQRPLLGYGFMCVSDTEFFDSIHSYAGKMAHNTFMQVLLNLGLVGFSICLLQMVYLFLAIGRSSNATSKWLAWMMLVPILVNSFTEFGIFGDSNYGIQFYQLIILMFAIQAQPAGQMRQVVLPSERLQNQLA